MPIRSGPTMSALSGNEQSASKAVRKVQTETLVMCALACGVGYPLYGKPCAKLDSIQEVQKLKANTGKQAIGRVVSTESEQVLWNQNDSEFVRGKWKPIWVRLDWGVPWW